MKILAKFFQRKQHSILFALIIVVGLFGVALVSPKSAFAQACGIPGGSNSGTCKLICGVDEYVMVPANTSGYSQCNNSTTTCCRRKYEPAACTETCNAPQGCACPANCQNKTAGAGSQCGVKQQVTNPAAGAAGGAGATGTDIFGKIDSPQGVDQFTPADGSNGLLNFISMLIKIFTVICGLLTFFNFIFSGYAFIMSDGNAKSVETVRNRLTYSILGLVLIVSSYTIIALVSLIIFGNAGYILNPTITPPGATP